MCELEAEFEPRTDRKNADSKTLNLPDGCAGFLKPFSAASVGGLGLAIIKIMVFADTESAGARGTPHLPGAVTEECIRCDARDDDEPRLRLGRDGQRR